MERVERDASCIRPLAVLGKSHTVATSLKLSSQSDHEHANASASMISLFVAKAGSPSCVPAALSHTPIGLQNLSRLTQNRQALCLAASRASCTWVRNDVKTNRRAIVARTPAYMSCGIRPVGLFSTSTTRRLQIENDPKESNASRSGAEVGSALRSFSH